VQQHRAVKKKEGFSVNSLRGKASGDRKGELEMGGKS